MYRAQICSAHDIQVLIKIATACPEVIEVFLFAQPISNLDRLVINSECQENLLHKDRSKDKNDCSFFGSYPRSSLKSNLISLIKNIKIRLGSVTKSSIWYNQVIHNTSYSHVPSTSPSQPSVKAFLYSEFGVAEMTAHEAKACMTHVKVVKHFPSVRWRRGKTQDVLCIIVRLYFIAYIHYA